MKFKFYIKSGTLHISPTAPGEVFTPCDTTRKIAEAAVGEGDGFGASWARVQLGHFLFTVTGDACRTLNAGKRVILHGIWNACKDSRDAMKWTEVPRRNRGNGVQKPQVKRPAPKCFIPADKEPSARGYKIGKKGRIIFRADWHIITFSRDRRRHEWRVTPEQFNKAEYDVKMNRVDNLGIFCQQFMLAGMKEVK